MSEKLHSDHSLSCISFIGVVNAWGAGITFDDLPTEYLPAVVSPTSGLCDVTDRAPAARLELGIFVIVRPETVSDPAIKITHARQTHNPDKYTVTSQLKGSIEYIVYVTFHVPVLTFNWTHFPIDCWLRLTPDSGSGAGVVAVLFILIKHKTTTWHFHNAHLLDYFISPGLFNRKPGLTFLEICIKGRNDCAGKASDTALVLILNVKFTLLHPDTLSQWLNASESDCIQLEPHEVSCVGTMNNKFNTMQWPVFPGMRMGPGFFPHTFCTTRINLPRALATRLLCGEISRFNAMHWWLLEHTNLNILSAISIYLSSSGAF